MRTIVILAVGILALLLAGAPISAQTASGGVTVETCRTMVAQYGVPEGDPVLTFQGGSLEAQQVAFCQSLARTAASQGTDLGEVFATQADRGGDGTVDLAELETYFVTVRNGGAAETIQPAATPPAGSVAATDAVPGQASQVPIPAGGAGRLTTVIALLVALAVVLAGTFLMVARRTVARRPR